ncbi:hypothetical protein [Azospirillum sp. sgz301742]
MLSTLCLGVAACSYTGESFNPTAMSGSSGAGMGSSGSSDYTAAYGTAQDPANLQSRIWRAGSVGGIDNGMYPGVERGWSPLGGSSSGVAAGPPGSFANNQMDRISQ